MNESTKLILISGALLAALAVILGAFGAHGLKKTLSEEMLVVYKTAVDYHFIHALGILLIGLLHHYHPESRLMLWAAVSLFIGILVFSGSLYTLSITEIKKLGMITPLGGLAFITGWVLLAIGVYKT
jgi:uncharacterized membrane protein YgdD (TMEM256/DUF423 family)